MILFPPPHVMEILWISEKRLTMCFCECGVGISCKYVYKVITGTEKQRSQTIGVPPSSLLSAAASAAALAKLAF